MLLSWNHAMYDLKLTAQRMAVLAFAVAIRCFSSVVEAAHFKGSVKTSKGMRGQISFPLSDLLLSVRPTDASSTFRSSHDPALSHTIQRLLGTACTFPSSTRRPPLQVSFRIYRHLKPVPASFPVYSSTGSHLSSRLASADL